MTNRSETFLPANVLRPLGRMRTDALAKWAARTQQSLITIDCSGCSDKRDVLAAFARSMALAEWFGMNWDALYDALADLPRQRPAAGYVLLLRNVPGAPGFSADDRAALDALLGDVVNDYAERKLPFRVLVD